MITLKAKKLEYSVCSRPTTSICFVTTHTVILIVSDIVRFYRILASFVEVCLLISEIFVITHLLFEATNIKNEYLYL